MTDQTPHRPGGPIPKVRADDARGAPKGAGTIRPEHGGRIGNPPYIATDESRARARELAQVFPIHSRHLIARLMGISVSTLDRHHGEDMELGRAEMLLAVGQQLVTAAKDGEGAVKGDRDAQKFIMARLGGWSTKLEVTGKDGGPVHIRDFDLSNLSEDEKRLLLGTVNTVLDGDAQGEDDAAAS